MLSVYICTHLDLLLGGVLDLRLRDGGDPLRGGGDRPNRDDRGGELLRRFPRWRRRAGRRPSTWARAAHRATTCGNGGTYGGW